MQRLLRVLTLSLAMLLAPAAQAALVRWDLNAVVDSMPGSAVTGYFEFDKTTGNFGAFDLLLTGVSPTYAGTTSGNVALGQASVTTGAGTFALDFPTLYANYPLATVQAQAVAALTPVTFLQFTHAPYIPTPYTVSGTARAVPEPAIWAMLVIGFGLTGLALRSRSVLRVAPVNRHIWRLVRRAG